MRLPETDPKELDPELLDVMIQSISVLSNVATLAATWLAFRRGSPDAMPGREQNTDNIRVQLRQARRSLEDAFEAVEAALRILFAGMPVDGASAEIGERTPRFGQGVKLAEAEMQRLNNHLAQLEHAALNARSSIRGIQQSLQHANLPSTENVAFNPDEFNVDLNYLLFDSTSFNEAVMRLRSLQRRAEEYITDLTVALRVN